MSRKQLVIDGEEESDLPEWVIVVEEPFSDDVVCKAIEKWLLGRGYDFEVRMIPLEEARGSGLIRKLREMEGRVDKRKVFYYEGFYGSLVPDVESDRLLGRVEGITQDIVYEGKTVGECEQRFREAVSGYKKG
jgi:hypothetical protein